MKLVQLKYLQVVAREGSFSRAAAVLSLAQPAISQQIKNLEDELGARLFHRTQKGTTLTSAGQIMLGHAERVLERIELARIDVASNSDDIAGEVTLQVNNAMANRLLPPLVRVLNHEYPGIVLNASPHPSHQVQLNLENHRIDLGVLADRNRMSKVNAKRISVESLYFLCNENHEAAADSEEPITLARALEFPMVSTKKGQHFRQFLDGVIEENLLDHNIRYETDDLVMIFSHVNSGLACTILPRCAVYEIAQPSTVVVRRIVEPEIAQPYLVAWPKSLPLSSAGTIVRDTIVQICRDELD